MKKIAIYMLVTRDRYQLPTFVTESIDEIAEKAGVKKDTISYMLSPSYRKRTKRKRTNVVRVYIDDD